MIIYLSKHWMKNVSVVDSSVPIQHRRSIVFISLIGHNCHRHRLHVYMVSTVDICVLL